MTPGEQEADHHDCAKDGNCSSLSEDASITDICIRPDPAAFDEIHRRHSRGVYQQCRKIVRDHGLAQDLTQDTFLVLLNRSGTLKAKGALRSWLYRVAHNLSVNYIRKIHRETPVESISEIVPQGSPAGEDQVLLVLDCLDKIKSREQAIALKLLYFEGLSYREIGKVMGLSPTKVQSRIENGRESLRRIWQAKLLESPEAGHDGQ